MRYGNIDTEEVNKDKEVAEEGLKVIAIKLPDKTWYLLFVDLQGSLKFDPAELRGPMHLYKEWLFVKTSFQDEQLLRD